MYASPAVANGVGADAGAEPQPIVKIDNQHDPFATLVTVEFGDRLGELLDTVRRWAARARAGAQLRAWPEPGAPGCASTIVQRGGRCCFQWCTVLCGAVIAEAAGTEGTPVFKTQDSASKRRGQARQEGDDLRASHVRSGVCSSPGRGRRGRSRR